MRYVFVLVACIAPMPLIAQNLTGTPQVYGPNTVYGLSTGSGNVKISASLDGESVNNATYTQPAATVGNSAPAVENSATSADNTLDLAKVFGGDPAPAQTPKKAFVPGQSDAVKAALSDGKNAVAASTDRNNRSISDTTHNANLLAATATAVGQHAASIAPQLDANGKEYKKTMDDIAATQQQLASVSDGDGSEDSRNAAASQRAALQAKLDKLNSKKDDLHNSTQALIVQNGKEANQAMVSAIEDPVNGMRSSTPTPTPVQ